MPYLNPARPIVVRVEANFLEGFSAELFRNTGSGLQPVHFISRTMTDTEKRYSQTEKDALYIGQRTDSTLTSLEHQSSRSSQPTSHCSHCLKKKKTVMRPPLGIDKRVMRMQDVDSELIYEPGKDNVDPLDYLSRHPLPEKGKDVIKSVIKYVLKAKHVVLEAQIKEETCRDTQFQKLTARILTGDWEYHKKYADISPFYSE